MKYPNEPSKIITERSKNSGLKLHVVGPSVIILKAIVIISGKPIGTGNDDQFCLVLPQSKKIWSSTPVVLRLNAIFGW